MLFKKSYHSPVDLSTQSVLVTGGAGFIGSNIVEYLLKFGGKKSECWIIFSPALVQTLKNSSQTLPLNSWRVISVMWRPVW